MKLGILSDTHDRLPTFRRAVQLFQRLKVDAIFHAGDYVAPFAARLIAPDVLADTPLYCIYGNNDGERQGLKKVLPNLQDGPLRVELAGKTLVMHHYRDWFGASDLRGADVVISGHDHTANIETVNDTLYLNPGECCGWVNDRPTCATLDLDTMHAQIIEVHE